MTYEETKKILETATSFIEESLNLFKQGREIYTSKHSDKDQAFTFLGEQIQNNLDLSNLLLREYAYLSGLKIPDIEIFDRAKNCVEYLSILSKKLDSSYPMHEEVYPKDIGKIMSILEERGLEELSEEVEKDYNSWDEVYDDIKRFQETHMKVWAAGIIDFLKFADYYFKCFKQVSFTEDELKPAQEILRHNQDVYTILFESHGEPIYYRDFRWVPSSLPPIYILESMLENIELSGFKENIGNNEKPENAWELFYNVIKGSLDYTNIGIENAQKDVLYHFLDEFGKISVESAFSRVIPSLIRENNDKKLKHFLEKIKEIKPKEACDFDFDILMTEYYIITNIARESYDSLITLYHETTRTVIKGLPRVSESPLDKERLSKELILSLAQKSAKQNIKLAESVLDVTESLLDKIKNKEIQKPKMFTYKEIDYFIEGNKIIRESLHNILSGLKKEIKEPPMHLAGDILLSYYISYLFQWHQEKDVSRWNEVEEFIRKPLKENKPTWGLVDGLQRGTDKKITNELTLTRKKQAERTWILFRIHDLDDVEGELSDATEAYRDQIINYREMLGFYKLAEKFIPNALERAKKDIESLFKDPESAKIFNVYLLEAILVQYLLRAQNKIDKINLEKRIQPISIKKRIKELSTDTGSLYYEKEEINDWIAALSAFVNPDNPLNFFFYKERLKDAASRVEGSEIIAKDLEAFEEDE